jgi:hypothetical protein
LKKHLLILPLVLLAYQISSCTTLNLYNPNDSFITMSFSSNQIAEFEVNYKHSVQFLFSESVYPNWPMQQFWGVGLGYGLNLWHNFSLGAFLGADGSYSQGAISYWVLARGSYNFWTVFNVFPQIAADDDVDGVHFLPLLGLSCNIRKDLEIVGEYATSYLYRHDARVINFGVVGNSGRITGKAFVETRVPNSDIKTACSLRIIFQYAIL